VFYYKCRYIEVIRDKGVSHEEALFAFCFLNGNAAVYSDDGVLVVENKTKLS
jgi:hypothetical protein